MPTIVNWFTNRPLTPDDWIKEFGLQPLKKIPLTREQIAIIQFDARTNAVRYPCGHGVTRYCGICENGL